MEVGRAGGEGRWDGEVRVHYIRMYQYVHVLFLMHIYSRTTSAR